MVATNPDITRRDLMFAPRKFRVMQWAYNTPLIEIVHDPNTGALVLPPDGITVGLLDKQQGGRLANAVQIQDIRSHGEGGPTMQLPTQRDVTVGLQPQELSKINLENWWGIDLSDIIPDASGGVTFGVENLPDIILKRTVVLGKHAWNGLPYWVAYVGNRTNVSQRNEQNWQDADVMAFPYTLNFQGVDELDGDPIIGDIFGPGWQAAQEAADAGFYPAVTALAISPDTPTLSLVGTITQQFTLTDSNGNDRTVGALWKSSDSTKVTVTPAGLATAVAITPAPANEVQTITLSGTPTGTYPVRFKGSAWSSPIAPNASSSSLKSILEALSTIGSGNVNVAGTAGGPYTVTFQGALANTPVPTLEVDNTDLSGGAAAVSIATEGVAPVKVTAKVPGFEASATVTVTA
ncbi:hypothetical protein ORI20_14070 [Mycobacterium sp. CVI_P3]|uniref:Major tail protein n=1 Tax=Mycobacterium pinniadriaticum TaxID=2994102 RepID=A0ABT3SE90_9MYCO|nr:hypothetical protein [Mycobacterium pinniadriaticum]MCX2931407.1 hypothetical protein [Mycobacterium pinniadriaticum]MCX2937831.1 hypothetical protein [Mycobacterium pinniadriaticum]